DDAVVAVTESLGFNQAVAFVATEQSLDLHGLRAQLAAALPAYVIPAAIVPLDRLPLTWADRLDREALAASVVGDGRTSPRRVRPGIDDRAAAGVEESTDAMAVEPLERQVANWNDTARAVLDETVLATIATRVESAPDRIAVGYLDEVVTYATLDARANQLA